MMCMRELRDSQKVKRVHPRLTQFSAAIDRLFIEVIDFVELLESMIAARVQ